jgi:transposase InsO family protein
MTRVKRHKYLLVLVDTFLGWVEAFPASNKRATTVASIIVTHIIPQFGMLTSFQSDNGPEFTSQITQTIKKALNIPWQFQIP